MNQCECGFDIHCMDGTWFFIVKKTYYVKTFLSLWQLKCEL